MTRPSPFSSTEFSAPQERAAWFAERVIRQVQERQPRRVLDIGCGTGEHAFALAARMPRATIRGVDVSTANIAHAERARSASAAADRVSFACTDYIQHRDGVFDLIVSDSTLHLIPGPTETLLAKIAADLAPGGLLIASLPDAGPYNRRLWLARRILAALRSRWLDDLALAIAVRLYRGRHEREFLRERIPYLYLLPYRCEGRTLRDAARVSGLEWCGSEAAPHDSVMQPVHVLVTYRRVTAP